MKRFMLCMMFILIMGGCTNNHVERINPEAVKALAGSDDYTVEMMLDHNESWEVL